MAATGYTPILHYASGTTGNKPSAANLTSGSSGAEIAINYTDGLLFYKDNSGTVQTIASKLPLAIAYGGTGQTTASAAFNALSPITSTGDLIIGNGTNSATRLGIGSNTYILTSNGTTASWQAPPSSMVYPGAGIPLSTGTAWGTSFNNTTNPLSIAYGGTGLNSVGSNGTVLTSNGTTASWAAPTGSTGPIVFNLTTVSSNQTLSTGTNGFSVGPVTISSGYSVTVSSGQRWLVV